MDLIKILINFFQYLIQIIRIKFLLLNEQFNFQEYIINDYRLIIKNHC